MTEIAPELAPSQPTARSLAYLPVGAFAMVLGLGGLSIAWRTAGRLWGFGPTVGDVLAGLTTAVLALVLVGYVIKAVRHFEQVRAEWNHPVSAAFTGAISVSPLLLAALWADLAPTAATVMWWVGAAAQFVITLWVVRTWIVDAAIQQVHVHPAWFIPAVGNLIAPVAGAGIAPPEITWYFAGIGVIYYLGLLPIVLARLFTAGTLPPKLAPTLAILIAPPAVLSLAWVRLGGGWNDPLVKLLVPVALFQFFLLVVLSPSLRAVPFALGSWAYSFPLAALTAVVLGSTAGGGLNYGWLGAVLLGITSVAITALFVLTVIAAARGQICRPE